MNLLLDTNVYIDYLGRKEPFFPAAGQLMAAGFFGDAKLWVPAQSAVDAFYVLSKYISAAAVQDAIAESFKVITPVSLTEEELRRGTRLKWDDLEDCLISLATVKAQADYLVTRDPKGFERSPIPVVSPPEALALLVDEGRVVYDVIEF